MKDTDLQKIVLQTYYDLRNAGRFQWIEEDVPKDKFPPVESFAQLARICGQLAEQELIEWKPVLGNVGEPVGGTGQIRSRGVDVIEGREKSPITFTTVNNIHNPTNVQVGNNNLITTAISVEKLNAAIDHSNFSESEKAEAKSLWQKVNENKLLIAVITSVLGAAAKVAFDAAAHPK